jgi:glycosyltransferase involved in cell wall biosynthesis
MEINKSNLSILYFGTYSRGEEYARNEAIIGGLLKNGVDLLECHESLWGSFQKKMEGAKKGLIQQGLSFARAYLKLFLKFPKVGDFDVMQVGYIGHIDMFPARLLKIFHRKPLVFDAFYSLYDTVILDRGLYSKDSFQAWLLRRIDRWSCRMADMVLLDTWEHVDYFCKEFGLPKSLFLAVPLGTDEKNFFPRDWPEDDGVLDVICYSSYIPLHGLDVQIRAAEILREHKDIRFTFVGKGQLYPEIRALADSKKLDNITFIEWLTHGELVKLIARADVCMGIFGVTEKASRVIPYKCYEALAMRKPVCTGDSPAARELLTNGEHVLMSTMGDPQGLAENILKMQDPQLRKNLAENGHRIFQEQCTAEKMAEAILKDLHQRYPGLHKNQEA